ncbi:MAG: NADH-quinone oxidoreductase subunit NuoG [Chitinophagaceae bacterium]|nr:NADH-quinone oxidoreductase subunit NuoG [Chitinophagaceae bacterium]
MPKIFIDNTSYEVKAGKNVLEACLTLGFDLPYFCWHPAMGSVGACRQCAVKVYKDENDTSGKIIMSCMEGVRDGMHLSIDDKAAKAFREQVIEWLMTNHPHDCPVCDEGGSCHLQDMTVMTGHDYRRYDYKKRTYVNQYLGPFIHHEMNRCIQCYRCVRFYKDYAGGKDLNVFAAHNHVYFGREKDGTLESPFSGNLAEVCPTGVFTDKTLRQHYTRKWDLTSAPSVCQHCSVGCNTIAGERYGGLRNIVNRYNAEVNGYFLCDRGRFGYEFVNSENRITKPQVMHQAVDENALMHHLETVLTNHSLIGIGSPRASMESNFALLDLVGKENFFCGVYNEEMMLERRITDILDSGKIPVASLKQIEDADAVVILGEDIWNTAPMMALAVRQSVMKTGGREATEKTPMPEWHELAVKELQQNTKGFMVNVTVTETSLDEIASLNINAAPDDIARLGFAIANHIHPSLELKNFEEAVLAKAKTIADELLKCSNPVIITGTSCYNDPVLRAAFDIAAALKAAGKAPAIAFVVPECNSMGLAMMRGHAFDTAVRRVNREPNVTAVILEQDLYRNLPAGIVDEFLSKCRNIIVLDSLNNATTEKAHVLIPASTFAEGDGTLISYEGRAQRYYQVYVPDNKYIRESWKWLSRMKMIISGKANGHDPHHDSVISSLETALRQFAGISAAAPSSGFSIHGEQIPREPHRYSGRTAMLANRNVSEPKPVADGDSPLSFTMEGYQGTPPSSAIPFFWKPGWNSPQAVNKYQQEIGGDLIGGNPGVRLFVKSSGNMPEFFKDYPEHFRERQNKWLLLPQSHVFGSDELSVYSAGIAGRSPEPYMGLSPVDAKMLDVTEGSQVTIKSEKEEYSFPVKIVESLRNGIVLVSKGLPGTQGMSWGNWVELAK